MSSGNNQGRGSSSQTPNQTTPPRGLSPNRPRTTSPIVAASSPNRPRSSSLVASENPNTPMFQRPEMSSPQRPLGVMMPWPLAPGQGGPVSGSTGLGLQGPFSMYGVPGAMAVPVGGGGGGSPSGQRLGLGRSPTAKKRALDGGPSSVGEGATAGETGVHRCTICTKTFASIKALFGHLRSHPERGYKGAHPPPTFNAVEEFSDFPGANLPAVAQGGGQAVMAEAQEVDVAQAEIVAEEEAAVLAPRPFRAVLDLNDSPPASDDE